MNHRSCPTIEIICFVSRTSRESEIANTSPTLPGRLARKKKLPILWDIHGGTGGQATWRWVSDGGHIMDTPRGHGYFYRAHTSEIQNPSTSCTSAMRSPAGSANRSREVRASARHSERRVWMDRCGEPIKNAWEMWMTMEMTATRITVWGSTQVLMRLEWLVCHCSFGFEIIRFCGFDVRDFLKILEFELWLL